jgi:hypothetical protein
MSWSSYFKNTYEQKSTMMVIGVLLLVFYRFMSNSLFSQLANPPFLFAENEVIYRFLQWSHLPQQIAENTFIAALLDLLLFLLPLLFLLTQNLRYIRLVTVLLLLYFFTFNRIAGHHYHGWIGAILITIPFWTKSESRFNFLWRGVRYYWIMIFASAALWKIARGSAFYEPQLSNILLAQQADLLLQHATNWKADIVRYLIQNPSVGHKVLLLNVALQLSFAIGFFTVKFDRVLCVLTVLFVVINYFLMGILSAELLVLNLVFLFPTETKIGEQNQA